MSHDLSTHDLSSLVSEAAAPPAAAGQARTVALDRMQRLMQYCFRDLRLLDQALTHSSLAYEQQQPRHPRNDNEQLEFLGDAVLGLVVTEQLYKACPEFTEGTLTRLRAQLVSRKYLGQIAEKLQLGEYLNLGKGEERSGGRKKTAIIANMIEALIAAVYLDGGLQPAASLVDAWLLQGKLDELVTALRSGESVADHKSALQEYFQASGLGQPHYMVTAESGPDHRKSFLVAVKLTTAQGGERGEQVLASASGTRKKSAEQEAARLALEVLRLSVGEPQLP